jgi:hypothetical protein
MQSTTTSFFFSFVPIKNVHARDRLELRPIGNPEQLFQLAWLSDVFVEVRPADPSPEILDVFWFLAAFNLARISASFSA